MHAKLQPKPLAPSLAPTLPRLKSGSVGQLENSLIFRETGLHFSINHCEKHLEYPGYTCSGVGHKLAIAQCREPVNPPLEGQN